MNSPQVQTQKLRHTDQTICTRILQDNIETDIFISYTFDYETNLYSFINICAVPFNCSLLRR
ncbi:MAG: hypothetical protein DWQ05_18525 [Calditrichaeota bacterium]|nr:MAG: hypothetical protein DWQ05_18525 [Calditrichota bacterium]